ncbi:MAG: NTP transferase domain-containing protein [candidate division Zixibacteria bacterium]|nr:NTP transferase domain-containing protein [candidate division Zixibacteria bacterium]
MKGVILAGGLGTRLYPLTKITNKHLLPVFDQPMIFYPIQTLVEAGIKNILIVTGGNSAGDFLRLLGNGRAFGLKHLNYTYQEKEGGIAEAIGLAEHFAEGEKVLVMLGDNLIFESIRDEVEDFKRQRSGAKIFLKKVQNPKAYGVAEIKIGRVLNIVEKPKKPKSDLAVIGIYMYDNEVFDIVKTLKPSARGELEVTDINNAYIDKGTMTYSVLKGFWADAGESIDALAEAGRRVYAYRTKRTK